MLVKRSPEDSATPPAAIARRIAANTAEIKELEKKRFLFPKIGANSMRVGQVGLLAYNQGELPDDYIQVVEVFQVVDDGSMLVKLGSKTIASMQVKTAGVTDGARYQIRGSFEVIGTLRYDTPSGTTNTVFKLAEFDPGPLP